MLPWQGLHQRVGVQIEHPPTPLSFTAPMSVIHVRWLIMAKVNETFSSSMHVYKVMQSRSPITLYSRFPGRNAGCTAQVEGSHRKAERF